MKPNLPLPLSPADREVVEWFADAKRRGYCCALMDREANVLDLHQWMGRPTLTRNLVGTNYAEWMDPEHIPGFMMWVEDSGAPNPIAYRFVTKTSDGPRMKYASMAKTSGDDLRLLIGTESFDAPAEDKGPPGVSRDSSGVPPNESPVRADGDSQ